MNHNNRDRQTRHHRNHIRNNERPAQQQASSLLEQALLSPTSCDPLQQPQLQPQPQNHSVATRISHPHPLPRIEETEQDTSLASNSIHAAHNNNINDDDTNDEDYLCNALMMENPNPNGMTHHHNNNNNNNNTNSSFVETSFTFRSFWKTLVSTATTATTHRGYPPTRVSSQQQQQQEDRSRGNFTRRRQLRRPDHRTANENPRRSTSSSVTGTTTGSTNECMNGDDDNSNNNYTRNPVPADCWNENSRDEEEDDYYYDDDDEYYPEYPTENLNDGNDDDAILNRCYFWSFLFQNYNTNDQNDHGDGDANEHTRDEAEQQELPTFVPLLGSAIILIVIWILGIHSMMQTQSTLSTDFVSLFEVSNRANNIDKNNIIHALETIPSYSSALPIILILSSDTGTNTWTENTTTAEPTKYQPRNDDTSRCVPTSKISRRGTVQYKHGHDYATGLEQFLVDRMKNETEQSQQGQEQPSSAVPVSNNTNTNSTAAPMFRMSSYFSYMDNGLEWWARHKMATPDGASVFVQIQYSTVDTTSNGTDRSFRSRTPTTVRQVHKLRQCLINAIEEFTDQYYNDYDSKNLTIPLCLTVQPTGMPYLEAQLSDSIHKLTTTVLLYVLPTVILAVSFMMWYSYHANLSWIWIIPFAIITTSVSILCITVQYIMIPYIPSSVSLFTPLIMIVMSIVTSCIQIISLLSRYLEEIGGMVIIMISPATPNHGSSPSRAVRRMLKSSGSTMISTGCIYTSILLTFLIGSDSVFLQSLFIGILLATIITSCVTIGMMYTLLKYTPLGCLVISKKKYQSVTRSGIECTNDDPNHSPSEGAEVHEHNELNRQLLYEPSHNLLAESFAAQMLPTPRNSIWMCIARNIVHPYRAIILILVILQILLPVALHLKRIQLSYQPMNVISSSSKSGESYRTLGRHIGRGRLYPYRIVFDGHASNTSMTTKAGFAAMHSVINEVQSRNLLPLSFHRMLDQESLENTTDYPDPAALSALHSTSLLYNHNFHATQLKYDMFNGIAIAQNTIVSYDMFLAAKYCATPTRKKNYCPFELLRTIAATNEQVTSNDTFATYIVVELGVDPFSSGGIEWLRNARNKVDRFQQAGNLDGINVDIIGFGGLVYDSVVSLYKPVHILILVSVVTAVIFMTIFFQSLFLPIRSAMTIGLTLSFSLGLAIAVYQDGIFNWTRVSLLQSDTEDEGMCWLVPVFAFPVIVGLSLMLDAQLLSRILEFRESGYEHKSSIALGLDAVGGCNTCTGVILTIIFGALLVLGENRMLQQWSLVVVSAVLLDTFVIRTMVVPVMISSVSFSWWPRRLPQEKFCLEEFNFRNPLHVDDSIGDNPSNYWEALVTSSEYEPLSHNR